ncbi:hypothetical protein [Massilia timonae]|uniref:hypothetical protein n=1 Tax=Massilia timonae TaxID=47229 RepID=UPI0028D100BD|nr:hypothetical protein [Massilia timonae]
MELIFDDPAALPHRSQPKPEFDKKMGNFYRDLPEYSAQLKALVSSVQALAAGGAYAFPYVFDSSTADGDPGVGKLRLGSTTQNAATVIRMDVQIVGGTDISNVLADLRAATSAVKGSIRLVKMTDPSKWMIFDVTQVALPSGYRNLTASARAASGTNPFANGDALMVYIDRNGDSGTVPGATELLAEMNVTTQVAALAFPNVFDSAHDWYLIDIQYLEGALSVQNFNLTLYVGGVENTGATSYVSLGANSASTNSAAAFFRLATDSKTLRGLLEIRGVNSNRPNGIAFDGDQTRPSDVTAIALRGQFNSTSNPSGFAIRGSTGFTAALIRVYGVRKV